MIRGRLVGTPTWIDINGADRAPECKECHMAERDNRRGGRREEREENPEFQDRLVAINRVSKTVKGGKRFGFAALVLVGDQRGRVGFGKGKAKEVPEAIRKATEQAKRGLVRVPLRDGRTLHHDIEGRHGAGKVIMRTAVPGTGIIAGGPMRAVFEMLGVQDVVAKSQGSQNPYNMIRATLDGLKKEASPRSVAQRRGKKVADILPQDNKPAAEAPAETVEA
jgi:small subunit ribosomal protein S5